VAGSASGADSPLPHRDLPRRRSAPEDPDTGLTNWDGGEAFAPLGAACCRH